MYPQVPHRAFKMVLLYGSVESYVSWPIQTEKGFGDRLIQTFILQVRKQIPKEGKGLAQGHLVVVGLD